MPGMHVNVSLKPSQNRVIKNENQTFLTLLQHLNKFIGNEVLKGQEILRNGILLIVESQNGFGWKGS